METALDLITSPIPAPRGAASVFHLWRRIGRADDIYPHSGTGKDSNMTALSCPRAAGSITT